MGKMIKALQYIWLAIGIAGLVMGAYFTATTGIKDAVFFFIITFAGGIMYAVNKHRYQKYMNQTNNQQPKN